MVDGQWGSGLVTWSPEEDEMSKQSQAKEAQGYEEKPFVKCCRNCHLMESIKKELRWYPGHFQETGLRCNLGDFAVKAMALCKEWEAQP